MGLWEYGIHEAEAGCGTIDAVCSRAASITAKIGKGNTSRPACASDCDILVHGAVHQRHRPGAGENTAAVRVASVTAVVPAATPLATFRCVSRERAVNETSGVIN